MLQHIAMYLRLLLLPPDLALVLKYQVSRTYLSSALWDFFSLFNTR